MSDMTISQAIATAAAEAARARSWERALRQLAAGYRRALETRPAALAQAA